jgi:HK97 gp10 family phage protein
MSVETTDNTEEWHSEFNKAIERALEKVGQTCEKYAKEIVPVDTGRLRNSITHQQADEYTEIIGAPETLVGEDGSEVDSYAAEVELGTIHQKAQPYLVPAAKNNMDEFQRMIKAELQG